MKQEKIAVLTESIDPNAYWRKLKQRLKAEGNETVTNCNGLKMPVPDSKMRMTDVSDTRLSTRELRGTLKKSRPYREEMFT